MKADRKMRQSFFVLIILLLLPAHLKSQDKKIQADLKGYISSMQNVMFEQPEDSWIKQNIIHNRLNFRLYAGSRITFAVDLRNRFFISDMFEYSSIYADNLSVDRGFMDLTANIFEERSFVLNTSVDRLWLDMNFNSVQVRIGRQRINWGQTFVWNPNDIFNAYSYFDTDYPERPGSDAVRLQIYPDYSSSIELAASLDSDDDLTIAGLYRFNKWGYDIQLLSGLVSSDDIVFGAGWSGAFGSTSFRGEMSWFQPYRDFSDTTGMGLFTIGFDRGFSGSGMIQLQAMYCNEPVSFSNFDEFYSGDLTAKDLAFSEFSLFAGITYPVTPLVNISLSGIWYPDLDGFYAGPSTDISMRENLDLSFIWQFFNANLTGSRYRLTLIFLRMKYSF